MKKILLRLGVVPLMAAPVLAVVSCGKKVENANNPKDKLYDLFDKDVARTPAVTYKQFIDEIEQLSDVIGKQVVDIQGKIYEYLYEKERKASEELSDIRKQNPDNPRINVLPTIDSFKKDVEGELNDIRKGFQTEPDWENAFNKFLKESKKWGYAASFANAVDYRVSQKLKDDALRRYNIIIGKSDIWLEQDYNKPINKVVVLNTKDSIQDSNARPTSAINTFTTNSYELKEIDPTNLINKWLGASMTNLPVQISHLLLKITHNAETESWSISKEAQKPEGDTSKNFNALTESDLYKMLTLVDTPDTTAGSHTTMQLANTFKGISKSGEISNQDNILLAVGSGNSEGTIDKGGNLGINSLINWNTMVPEFSTSVLNFAGWNLKNSGQSLQTLGDTPEEKNYLDNLQTKLLKAINTHLGTDLDPAKVTTPDLSKTYAKDLQNALSSLTQEWINTEVTTIMNSFVTTDANGIYMTSYAQGAKPTTINTDATFQAWTQFGLHQIHINPISASNWDTFVQADLRRLVDDDLAVTEMAKALNEIDPDLLALQTLLKDNDFKTYLKGQTNNITNKKYTDKEIEDAKLLVTNQLGVKKQIAAQTFFGDSNTKAVWNMVGTNMDLGLLYDTDWRDPTKYKDVVNRESQGINEISKIGAW